MQTTTVFTRSQGCRLRGQTTRYIETSAKVQWQPLASVAELCSHPLDSKFPGL